MFTPVETTIGAVLIQFGTTSYLLNAGKTMGFSSVLSGLVFNPNSHNWAVVLGLALAALFTSILLPDFTPTFAGLVHSSHWYYCLSGALVGFGTKWSSGCTSGHMIYGLSRLRVRSLLAVSVFFASAVAVTTVFDLAPSCGPDTFCAEYDPLLTKFTNNRSTLLWLLGSGFISSYLVLPTISKKAASSQNRGVLQFINGLHGAFLFGMGLIISGMASPSKSLGFFAILNPLKFDPSLLLIIFFAIFPNVYIWETYIFNDLHSSLIGAPFDVTNNDEIPLKFLVGSAIFGIGWGSLGVCPGPGILGLFFNGYRGLLWACGFTAFYKIASYL